MNTFAYLFPFLRHRSLVGLAVLVAMLLVGCKADPQVQAQKHLQQAREYASSGKTSEAIIEYRRALQSNQRLAEAHFELAKLLIARQEYAEAVKELNTAINVDSGHREARLELVNLKLAGGLFAEAQKDAEGLLREKPDDPKALLLLAESARGLRDRKRVRETATRLLELEPNHGRALYLMGLLELSENRRAEGEDYLRKSIAAMADPTLPAAALVSSLLQRQKYGEAEEVIHAALAKKPASIELQYLQAGILLNEKRNGEAEQIFQKIKYMGDGDPFHRGALDRYYLGVLKEQSRAEAEYREILNRHPDDELNRYALAGIYLSQGRITDAEQQIETILKQKPNSPQALMLRGQMRLEQGRNDEGLQDLQAAVQAEPRWALARYFLGIAQMKKGNLKTAEDELKTASELDPNAPGPRLVLAQMAIGQGRNEQALLELNRLLEKKTDAAEPFLLRAIALTQRGDFAKAEKDLDALLRSFPQSAERATTLRTLSWIKLRQGKTGEARKFAEQALAALPTSAEALYLYALTFTSQGRMQEAVSAVASRVKEQPNWAAGYDVLGQLCILNGQPGEGEKHLRKAVELDPKLTSAWINLSEALRSTGNLDAAVNVLRDVAQREQKFSGVHVRLGQIYEQRNDPAQAKAAYQKALAVNQDDVIAKNNLAWLLAEQGGNIDVALRLAQEAKQVVPDDPSISDTLGWIYVKKQSFGNAIQHLKVSVEKNPKKAIYHYHLGVALFRNGQKAEAKQSLETALRIQPDFAGSAEAKHLLVELRN
jgi:tetratricopeptide (TPR) repeat protein